MRIFLRDERPIGSVQERLKARGEGEVSLILILDDVKQEVEVKLPAATWPRRNSPAPCAPCPGSWTCR